MTILLTVLSVITAIANKTPRRNSRLCHCESTIGPTLQTITAVGCILERESLQERLVCSTKKLTQTGYHVPVMWAPILLGTRIYVSLK